MYELIIDGEVCNMECTNVNWNPEYQPFGRAGIDFVEGGKVTKTPLYTTPPAAQPDDPTGQAPCVRHCEATAFQIVIKNLRNEIERLEAAQRTWVGSGDLERSNAYLTQPAQQEPLGGTREAFEKWAKALPNYIDISRFEAGYSDCNTDHAWAGWQAAQAEQEPDHGDELTIAYMSGVHRGKELAARPAPVQEPVAWCVIGDGKFGEYKMGQTFVDYEATHTYWENRGYELVPVYTNIPKENI
jgi:hypothetical protein